MVVIVAVSLTGCAGKLVDVVRAQAAKDLNCPESEVDVYDQRSDNYVRDYTVTGCGRSAHYQAACSMVEACVAYRPDKLGKDAAASESLTAGLDAVPQETVEEVVVAEDGTVTVNRSGPPAPEPKTPLQVAEAVEVSDVNAPMMSVTLRNVCPETVTLWFGPTPNAGEGRLMTLGSTNMATVRVKQGEQLWLLDRARGGTAGVQVDAGMSEVEIGCGGLSTR